MDRLNSMTIFTAVVDDGGFTAAADKMGISRAQASKAVMQLEAHLGTRLLNRTTRRTSLTEVGRIYYERCKAILLDIEEIESIAGEQTTRPNGTLTLSVPTSFGILQLNKAILEYLQHYPDVQISLQLADRFIDVVSEGFDVAIRIAELDDSSLVARKIAPCKRVFCASPQYLQDSGVPQVPSDLARHRCLIYSNERRPDSWTIHGPEGSEMVRVSGPVCADNGDVLKEAAIQGLGITLLPTFIVGSDLKAGRLVQVLHEYCPEDISIYAVFPTRRFLTAKVRTFVDFITQYFGEHPKWDVKN